LLLALSIALLIILSSEAFPSHRRCARDVLASDKKEKTCDKNDFINMDDFDNDILLVVKGSFSTIIRRIKSKKTKGKES
jgi:hypothetical protein